MNSIAVFCASSSGFDEIWAKESRNVGRYIASQQIKLIYGGGRVGLMGEVADGALENGGEVIGVIPHFLNSKEVGHQGVTELITVETMHERKMIMNNLSEGIIALPGGFGTMEELFEMITWAQLGLHKKPVGLLNINGFYDHLIIFVDQMVKTGLLKDINRDMLLIATTIEELISKMELYEAPAVPKWISNKNNL